MAVYIRFECGGEDRIGEDHGPFDFIQATYSEIRLSPEGDVTIASYEDGWWVTEDGQKWSDFIIHSGPDLPI